MITWQKAIFDTHGQDTTLNYRSGETVEILGQLDKTQADIDDVGNMYNVMFSDGFKIDAFEDELTFI